jgi:hypothetical protein
MKAAVVDQISKCAMIKAALKADAVMKVGANNMAAMMMMNVQEAVEEIVVVEMVETGMIATIMRMTIIVHSPPVEIVVQEEAEDNYLLFDKGGYYIRLPGHPLMHHNGAGSKNLLVLIRVIRGQ